MRRKRTKVFFVILVVLIAGLFFQTKFKQSKIDNEIIKEIHPVIGGVQNIISTTGMVLPKNRLEIKPPVNGRVETILIQEGEKVKAGQTLAWMSSTERAALLDAARGQGEAALAYWQDVYKGIPLISPIDGEVIVAKTQPGQTVSTSDPVLVLSDQLIARAQVDETDIGKVELNQSAVVILDAYPETKIKAAVQHIYYESKTVNNVTMYEVDLQPENVPPFFRSGMNATISFIVSGKENIMMVPLEFVNREEGKSYVWLKNPGNPNLVKERVELGLSDDKNVEILSGLSLDDTVIVKTQKLTFSKEESGSNPFMPFRGKKKETK